MWIEGHVEIICIPLYCFSVPNIWLVLATEIAKVSGSRNVIYIHIMKKVLEIC